MNDRIRAEAIRTLYQQARNSLGAALIITVYMTATAWPYTQTWIVLTWTTAVLCIQVARVMLIRGFDRHADAGADLEPWARYYTIHQFVTGIVWGASIYLFGHPDEPITIALTLCCLYSIASGSVPAQAYNPPTLFALVLPVYTMILVRLVSEWTFGYVMVGVTSALYGVTMLAFCRVQARSVYDTLRTRFENQELVEALTVEKAEAENARREAERASLAKSQFLAAASHDLRQPLYALSLFSASLGTLKLDAEGRDVVGNIQDSIAAMESLFVGLLDVSRLDAGVVKPQLTPISIDALFDRLSQYFLPVAIERGLDLRFRSDDEWVTSDATLLEQVLSNLVSNALRCTKRGAVLVAARKRGDNLRFEVWDTGIGIDPGDAKRIFDEFVQVGNPERDRRRGLGLGLSIAQRSVVLIGSRIELMSRLGRGSRFAFLQPLTTAPARPRLATEVRRRVLPAPLPANRRLLVVDDDRDVRTALGDLLTRWDVQFDSCVDADEALSLIHGGARYGIVFADYRLPGSCNGLDLITEIERQHPAPRPACVLITGDFDPKLIGTAQARSVTVLHKPLSPTRIRELLQLPARAAPRVHAEPA